MTQAKTEKATKSTLSITKEAQEPVLDKEASRVASEVEEPRESIEAIRNSNNPLSIKADKKWPNIFTIHREKGNTPSDLSGKYTSYMFAEKAITKHLR